MKVKPERKVKKERKVSPEPMEVGTPTLDTRRRSSASINLMSSALSSTRLSDSSGPATLPGPRPCTVPLPDSPPAVFTAAELPAKAKPATRGRRLTGATGRTRRKSEPPSPASREFTMTADSVHEIFPTTERDIPMALTVGDRPPFPYPFTGSIDPANVPRVREALERDWTEEFLRQIDPTVGSVARILQLRAIGRWMDGWRRSRRTGEWLYLGPNPSPPILEEERERAGETMIRATARVRSEEGAAEERRWVKWGPSL